MIQRPQTVYLFLAVIINLAVFFSAIYRTAMHDPAVWIGFGFAISLALCVLIACIAVFFYSNRTRQLKMVKLSVYMEAIAFGIAAGILFSTGVPGRYMLADVPGFAFIGLAFIFLWLAGRQIKKDEDLVQSMDRIR